MHLFSIIIIYLQHNSKSQNGKKEVLFFAHNHEEHDTGSG